MVNLSWEANSEGGGVAWREDGYVRWHKGLDLEQMKEYCETLPLPFIAHFRIASVGGTSNELCHPFPIDKTAPLETSGKTKGYVLFHNGHWSDWKKMMVDTVLKSGIPVPTGKWTDTRALAFIASVYGVGMLEMIDEKTVAFGPGAKDCYVTGAVNTTNGWKLIDKVWCSNDFWITRKSRGMGYQGQGYTPPILCMEKDCKIARYAETEYCWRHKDLIKKDVDDTLPVIDTSAAVGTVKDEKKDSKVNGSGGGRNLLPFAEADKLYKLGVLSKTQWKKARKNHMREQEKLVLHQRKLQMSKQPMTLH